MSAKEGHYFDHGTVLSVLESNHGRLDAVVNNAAVARPKGSLVQMMAICFQTSATRPLLMGEAFGSLLKKLTTTPRIINVTGDQGTIAMRLGSSGLQGPLQLHNTAPQKLL